MLKKILEVKISLGLSFIILTAIVTVFALIFLLTNKKIDQTFLISDSNNPSSRLDFGARSDFQDFDFFTKTKNELIKNNASFIEANLSEMKLSVFKDGQLKKEVKILTKGREGMWWETPAGIYRIETKEKKHFSSFGHVYQPWSMAFQGNFFIHGWPYYPDGRPVSGAYSGGCIRLSDEDALGVYNLSEVGMPVIVFEKDFGADDFKYKIKQPQLTAERYLVADLHNNFVFTEGGSKDAAPIASITKLVTALVASEFINLERPIVITQKSIIQTSKPRLKVDSLANTYDLLYPLLEESSNEAAEALAGYIGRDRFIGLMNRKGKAIGMENAVFQDPQGIGSKNVATVTDLFSLARYIYNNRRFVFNISSGKMRTSQYGEPSFKNIENFNLFSNDGDFIGGKIGKTTAAKETMLSVFDMKLNGSSRPIVIIVLGSNDVLSDVTKIKEWLYANY